MSLETPEGVAPEARRSGGRRVGPLLAAAAVALAVAAGGALAGTGHLGPSRSSRGAGGGTGAAPSPRGGAAMAWDQASGSVILFGGRGATGFQDDTWSWDGSAWHRLSPAASPTPRAGALLAADGQGGLVLFGGLGQTGGGGVANCVPPAVHPGAAPKGGPPGYCATPLSSLRDTWTWDGRTWTEQHPAHRPDQGAGGIAFDSAHSSAVIVVHPLRFATATGGSVCAVAPVPPVHPGGVVAPPPSPPSPPGCLPTPIVSPPPLAADQLWRWTGSDWAPVAAPSGGAGIVGLATDPAGGLLVVTASTTCQSVAVGVAEGGLAAGGGGVGYAAGACTTVPPEALPPAVVVPLACPPAAARPAPTCAPPPPHPVAPPPPVPVPAPVLPTRPRLSTLRLGADGIWRTLGTGPAPVDAAALAADLAHGQVVALGSAGVTAVWDGRTWAVEATGTGPGPRSGAAIAYDQADRHVVLFGGSTPGGEAADTWTWDGSGWARVAGTAPSPEPAPPVLRQLVAPSPRPSP